MSLVWHPRLPSYYDDSAGMGGNRLPHVTICSGQRLAMLVGQQEDLADTDSVMRKTMVMSDILLTSMQMRRWAFQEIGASEKGWLGAHHAYWCVSID